MPRFRTAHRRFLHVAATWAALAASLGAMPAAATARYECLHRTAAASHACSRCHTRAAVEHRDCHGARQAQTLPRPCCLQIATPPAATTPAALAPPAPRAVTIAWSTAQLALGFDAAHAAAAVADSPPRSSPSPPATISLRL